MRNKYKLNLARHIFNQTTITHDIIIIEGRINLNCPDCGYVMVGLSESRCPECGARFTLDELVRRQDYHLLRSVDRATRPPPIETHEAIRPALEGG